MMRLMLLLLSPVIGVGRWVLRDRKRFCLSVIAVALWLTWSGYVKAQTSGIPSGLALITVAGPDPAITLWSDDNGYGASCAITLTWDGTELVQSYACSWEKELWKAAAIVDGFVIVESGGAITTAQEDIYAGIQPNWALWSSLGGAPTNCPYGVIPGIAPDGFSLAFHVTMSAAFGSGYTATEANPGPFSMAALKGFFQECSSNHPYDYLVMGSVAGNQYEALGASSDLHPCCDGGGGGSGTGACVWVWNDVGGYWGLPPGNECPGGGQCCPPPVGTTGATYTGACVNPGDPCDGGGGGDPDPCLYYGGDADSDGCCDYSDCDPGDSSKCSNCDGDPDPDDPCGTKGDGDDDGCCSDVDYDDADPEVCEESDTDACGRCKWELRHDGDPEPPEDDPEGEPVQKWKWVNTRACKDSECKCKAPTEDPNDPEVMGDRTTECKAECECEESYLERREEIMEKIEEWLPDLAALKTAGQGQAIYNREFDLALPDALGGFSYHFKFTLNFNDLGPLSDVLEILAAFIRSVCLVFLAWWFVVFIFDVAMGG